MPITEILADRYSRWRRWGFAAASLVVHAGLLAALVVGTAEKEAMAAEPEEEEEVTFVDISRVAPPPPPAASATPQQPEPQQPDPTPRTQQPQPRPSPRPQPRTPPRAADIIDPVDSLPDEPLGDAPPAPAPPRVESSVPSSVSASASASGGQAGGVEGGEEGGKVGGVVGGQGDEVPDPGGTFIAAVVDKQATLSNRSSLPRLMKRLYPDMLQDAGIGGRVIVQFVVNTNGRVDMSTFKILSSTHDGFEDPTRKAIREFRFSPARVGDRKVRMLTQMPIVWEVQR